MNRIDPPSRRMTLAASAAPRPASAWSFRPATARTRSSVGRAVEATVRSALTGGSRKRREASPEQLLEVVRHRESFARVRTGTLALQSPRDLQGVERVPTRDLVELGDERSGEGRSEMIAKQSTEFLLRYRPHRHASHRHPIEGLRQLDRDLQTGPCRGEDADPLILQTTNGEPQYASRRRIDPLDVVDGEDERSRRRERL